MKKILLIFVSLFVFNFAFALKIQDNKIIDSFGNSIENKEYNRIILLDPAAVEIFYMLDAENKITAIANTNRTPIWPEEKTSLLPTIGTIVKPSLEKTLINNPDLVILNPMITNFGDTLKEKNINFLINQSNNFEDILENIKIFGKISGKDEKAKELYVNSKNKLENIKTEITSKNRKLKGLFIFSTNPMMAFTDDSLPGQIFKTLGVENIATSLPGTRPIISSEYLVTQNPDFIVGAMSIQNKDDIIRSNPVIANTSAGKNENIYILNSNKILRATPRIFDEIFKLNSMLDEMK